MKYYLAVSVVVYNTNIDDINKVIKSVLGSSVPLKMYIIDNSETDAIGEQIDTDNKNVIYIFNNNNLGYGSAHNIAMRRTIEEGIPYHVVINPDVWFDEDVLLKLFQYMEEYPNVGLVMPKILYDNGELQYLCKLMPTPADLIFRRFMPFKNLKEERTEKYEMHDSGYDKLMEVPILSGCFMFLRTESLEKVGIFDERYFMYLEDVDLSRRIHEKYKTIFYPHIAIYHGYAKGSYKGSTLLKHHIRSAMNYFNKWGWTIDTERRKSNRKALSQFKME